MEPGVYYYYAAATYAIPGDGTTEFLSEIKKVTVNMGDNMLGIIDNQAELSVPTCGIVGKGIPLQLACTPFVTNECTISNITFYRNTASNYGGTQLAAGKALSYTDSVSAPGTYYYYAGVSYSISEEASCDFFTNIVAVTVSKDNNAAGTPIITTQPKSVTAKPGDTVTFKVGTKGDNLHYKWWYVDAGATMAFDDDSPTISIKTEDMSWSGFSFWCEVSNTSGSVISEWARLTLSDSNPKTPQNSTPDADTPQNSDKPQPDSSEQVSGAAKILAQPNDASAKDGETVTFSCKAEGTVKYQWWHSEKIPFSTDDPVSVKLSDDTGLSGTATDTLTVTAV